MEEGAFHWKKPAIMANTSANNGFFSAFCQRDVKSSRAKG
jgi:hypothetical protein